MSEILNNVITIALRGVTVLPQMSVYLDMSRPMSVSAATNAQKSGQLVFLVAQKDASIENPGREQLEEYGVVARIRQIIKGADNVVRVLVVGQEAARLETVDQYVPFLCSTIEVLQPNGSAAAGADAQEDSAEMLRREAMLGILRELTEKYCKVRSNASRELTAMLKQEWKLDDFSALLACNLSMEQADRQKYLAVYPDEKARYDFLAEWLTHAAQVEQFRREYQAKIKQALDKQQKDYILREQMKVIRQELGENSDSDADRYAAELEKLEAPEEVRQQLEKEIRKLRNMNFGGPEVSVCQNYIETLLAMPWEKRTEESLDMARARQILEEDHYGLEKVKEQVLEFLAVRKLQQGKASGSGRILCLVGPPGTGKTSIARSVARALGRRYIRLSLGGVHDESEIRGHRRTYVAAMPGRIAAGIRKAGVKNPLLLLDELDKLGSDSFHGDVSSAMLEVLDGEQNFAFHDRYLEVGLDLSEVLFVATANTLQTIPQPLLDRMEVIEIGSYTKREKYEIAKRFLLPKQIKETGLGQELLQVDQAALELVISAYTREAGVRSLERQLGTICRKAALEYLEQGKSTVSVTADNLEGYLGRQKVHADKILEKGEVGIVRGLAWTSVGGVTLEVEVNIVPGKGGLFLTGQLGDVMKESAQTALSYVRSAAGEYGIDGSFFENHDIHIHIPEGAVPKDGPSAGITMAAAIFSAVTGKRVRPDVAMTGEVTLRGRVLPVGGLKEKLLAAAAAGIRTVLIPGENQEDIRELTDEVTGQLEIIPAERMEDVMKIALEPDRED